MIYYFFFLDFISFVPRLMVMLFSKRESVPICYCVKFRLFLFFFVSKDPFLFGDINFYSFYEFLIFYVDLFMRLGFSYWERDGSLSGLDGL